MENINMLSLSVKLPQHEHSLNRCSPISPLIPPSSDSYWDCWSHYGYEHTSPTSSKDLWNDAHLLKRVNFSPPKQTIFKQSSSRSNIGRMSTVSSSTTSRTSIRNSGSIRHTTSCIRNGKNTENNKKNQKVNVRKDFTNAINPEQSETINIDIKRHPLSCPICRNKYKNPKVLPCLHTFCEACLISYLPPESLTLTCPDCRQQSILPQKGISALQTNFCISNLSMDENCVENGIKLAVQRRCMCCGQKATYKCNTCEEDDVELCDTCSKTHPNIISTNLEDSKCNHELSPISSTDEQSNKTKNGVVHKIQNGNLSNGHHSDSHSSSSPVQQRMDLSSSFVESPTNDSRYLLCPSHSGQTLRFYCRDCDTAVCSSCTDIEHARHLTIRVLDAVQDEKLRLNELKESVQQKIGKFETGIRTAEKSLNSLLERKNEAVYQVHSDFNELIEKIKERRLKLLEEIDLQFVSKMDQIQKTRNLLVTHCEDVKECCGLTERALSHENETEILFVKKQIGNRLENYAKMNIQSILDTYDDSLEFDGVDTEHMNLNSVGRIISKFHKSWMLSGEIFDSGCVPVGRRHFLRLELLPSYSHQATLDLRLKDIQVTSLSREVVFSVEQPKESDSTAFLIRFLVSKTGPFTIGIIIKGQHIAGSPYQFNAYEADECRSASQSPIPYLNGSYSVSALHSPVSGYHSRIPKMNGPPSLPSRSRMSTPTRKFFSNGHIGSVHGGGSSHRSATLEDDLILKIGYRGRNRGEFSNPQGVISTENGRLVVTDSNNQCVTIFDNTGECKLRFGTRGRLVGQLQRPVGVAVLQNGNLAVSDYDNKWISIFDQTGKFMSRIGHGKLLGPKGIATDCNGGIYVVDNKASSVVVFSSTGKLLKKFGTRGNDEGQLAGPHFIAINSKGNIIVSDFHNHSIKVFDCEGDYLYSFGSNGEGSGQFNAPTGIAVDSMDNIIVADWGNSRIQVFDCQGSFLSYVNTNVEPLYGPQGLTVTTDGYIAIADSGNHCIKLYKYS